MSSLLYHPLNASDCVAPEQHSAQVAEAQVDAVGPVARSCQVVRLVLCAGVGTVPPSVFHGHEGGEDAGKADCCTHDADDDAERRWVVDGRLTLDENVARGNVAAAGCPRWSSVSGRTSALPRPAETHL